MQSAAVGATEILEHFYGRRGLSSFIDQLSISTLKIPDFIVARQSVCLINNKDFQTRRRIEAAPLRNIAFFYSADITTPCEFWFSTLVLTRLSCFWRDTVCSSLLMSKSFNTSSLHMFLGRPLDLILMGFHSVIFLDVFVFSILLKCPNNFTLVFLCFSI